MGERPHLNRLPVDALQARVQLQRFQVQLHQASNRYAGDAARPVPKHRLDLPVYIHTDGVLADGEAHSSSQGLVAAVSRTTPPSVSPGQALGKHPTEAIVTGGPKLDVRSCRVTRRSNSQQERSRPPPHCRPHRSPPWSHCGSRGPPCPLPQNGTLPLPWSVSSIFSVCHRKPQ
jgi:hypothetical protein